jgi:hypothetical protein
MGSQLNRIGHASTAFNAVVLVELGAQHNNDYSFYKSLKSFTKRVVKSIVSVSLASSC